MPKGKLRPWIQTYSSFGGRVSGSVNDDGINRRHMLSELQKKAQKQKDRAEREQAFRKRKPGRFKESKGKEKYVFIPITCSTESMKSMDAHDDILNLNSPEVRCTRGEPQLDLWPSESHKNSFETSDSSILGARKYDPANIPDIKPWVRSKEADLTADESNKRCARTEVLSRQIASAAKQKQLSRAVSVFRRLVTHERLIPTSYTYAALINAYVNSGHMSGAVEVLKHMRAVPGMMPNVVVYTTMLKGHMLSGDVEAAEALISEMNMNLKTLPLDIRAVNTFLRACQRVGDTSRALKMYQRVCVHFPKAECERVSPNCFTYKIITKLLAQSLRLDDLLQTIKEAKVVASQATECEPRGGAETAPSCKFWAAGCCDRGAHCMFYHNPDFTQRVEVEWVDGLAFMHVQLAHAAALLGIYTLVEHATEFATIALSKAENMLIGDTCCVQGSETVVNIDPDVEDSSAMYKRTTRRELHFEIRRIKEFCGRVLAGEQDEPDLVHHLCQTLIFRHTPVIPKNPMKMINTSSCSFQGYERDTKVPIAQPRSVHHLRNMLFERLHVGFGLGTVCKRSACCSEDTAKTYLRMCIADDCRIDFRALFSSASVISGSRFQHFTQKCGGASDKAERGMQTKCPIRASHKARPVKFEICAGNGDWAVAQAKVDTASDWIALELRSERVYSIFSRVVFEGINNLRAMGGDAMQVLSTHIRPGSVSHIFINFPEPPHHSASRTANNQLHLLTSSFFELVHSALVDGGVLTLFSDNQKYMRSLANTISLLLHENSVKAGEPMFLAEKARGTAMSGKGFASFENVAGLRLYRGIPGEGSGHIVHKQSYFDRFWEQGFHVDRYYLLVSKN